MASYLIGLTVFLLLDLRESSLMASTLGGFLLFLESLKAPFWDHYYLFCILMMLKHAVQHSSIKVFADDISLYSQVSTNDDCSKLQADLSCVYQWSLKW